MLTAMPEGLSEHSAKKYLASYMADRERGRTDLLWLCQNVLGYRDIRGADPDFANAENLMAGENHQPILDGLHKFSGRIELSDAVTMKVVSSKPRVEMWAQPEPDGNRNFLALFPRDHLKTSVITIAHSIQWILNYEDVRILLSFSNGDFGDKIMTAILGHFRYNATFRFLYPEWCPAAASAKDFGSLDSFTVPNRTRQITEPTAMAVSVGKMIAGTHQDVHKHCDLVDKENVKTVGALRAVNDHFGYTNPLLARVAGKQGWRDVEGTRYDFSDLYGTILDAESEKAAGKKSWRVVERSAEAAPGTHKTLWPHRYTWDALQDIRNDPTVGLYIYEAQYNQRCIPPSGGLATKEQVKTIPRSRVRELMGQYRIHTTVDLASLDDKATGDYCVMTTAGILPSGFIHILDIRHGHFNPFRMIQHFFEVDTMYRPLDFKMEKNHHAQVLEPFLKQEMARRGRFLNVLNIPRDNTASKKSRILGLQSWFAAGRLRFVEDIPCMGHLLMEITRFPKFRFDDILDTIADQLQHADGNGIETDLIPARNEDEPSAESMLGRQSFLGFDPETHRAIYAGHSDFAEQSQYYHERTGL